MSIRQLALEAFEKQAPKERAYKSTLLRRHLLTIIGTAVNESAIEVDLELNPYVVLPDLGIRLTLRNERLYASLDSSGIGTAEVRSLAALGAFIARHGL